MGIWFGEPPHSGRFLLLLLQSREAKPSAQGLNGGLGPSARPRLPRFASPRLQLFALGHQDRCESFAGRVPSFARALSTSGCILRTMLRVMGRATVRSPAVATAAAGVAKPVAREAPASCTTRFGWDGQGQDRSTHCQHRKRPPGKRSLAKSPVGLLSSPTSRIRLGDRMSARACGRLRKKPAVPPGTSRTAPKMRVPLRRRLVKDGTGPRRFRQFASSIAGRCLGGSEAEPRPDAFQPAFHQELVVPSTLPEAFPRPELTTAFHRVSAQRTSSGLTDFRIGTTDT